MADLNYIDTAQEVKISGQDSVGNRANFVGADANGNLQVKEYSNGTPGSAAPSTALQFGGTDGTNLRTLSTDTTGRLNISGGKLYTGTASAGGLVGPFDVTGCATIVVQVSGTYSASLTFFGSNNGTTYTTLAANQYNGGAGITGATISGTAGGTTGEFVINTAGLEKFAINVSSYVSGTATFTISVIPAAVMSLVYQDTPSNLKAAITGIGTTGSANGTPNNPVKVGAAYNSATQALSNNTVNDLQMNERGALIVSELDPSIATYSAVSTIQFTAAASATDIFTITGSASKTVRIIRIFINGVQTTASDVAFFIVKRSSANTGGTSSAATQVAHDSNDAAATATVLNYTANPSGLGTTVGIMRYFRGFIPTAALATVNGPIELDFAQSREKAIVLRGTSQVLAVNLNGVSVAGGLFTCAVEWTEE